MKSIRGAWRLRRRFWEAEGHTVLSRGRKHLRYYVQDYEKALFSLEECDSHLTSGPQYGTMSFASKLDSRADGGERPVCEESPGSAGQG